jgi:predicted nucleic acid-binding Zn ribbon protein
MSFKSINNLLSLLENQLGLQGLQQFSSVLECWSQVVGAVVASQTRPLAISRGVLLVATSSSALSNNLFLERQKILAKVNAHLPSPLADIHFSTARWHNDSRLLGSANSYSEVSFSKHPSRIENAASPPPSKTPQIKDPMVAFQHWAEVVRERSQHLPLCPQCQRPTPVGEIDRWGVCALCAPKQWQA